jgi:hypothetical protein
MEPQQAANRPQHRICTAEGEQCRNNGYCNRTFSAVLQIFVLPAISNPLHNISGTLISEDCDLCCKAM